MIVFIRPRYMMLPKREDEYTYPDLVVGQVNGSQINWTLVYASGYHTTASGIRGLTRLDSVLTLDFLRANYTLSRELP